MLCFRAQQGEVGERRETRGLALLQLAFRKGVVAAVDQGVEQRVVRVVGLQPYLPGLLRAPRAPGDLDELLSEFFACAEIRRELAFVHADHHHQREVRQVVALGQDLRAHEDAGPVAEFFQ